MKYFARKSRNIIGKSLTGLTGLENVTSVGGDLRIDENIALTSLTALDNVTSIGGRLSIYNNEALTSLTGLEGLTSIGGELYIGYSGGNPSLKSLAGLENIDAGSISGLRIHNNINLSTCEVFRAYAIIWPILMAL